MKLGILFAAMGWILFDVQADSMFWTYPQEVSAEFATEAEAQNASVVLDLLPPGKRVAFSARWDDTNLAHGPMSDTLAANGYKGTFYLNKVDANYVNNVVSRILKNGCSIGSHTETHPFLSELLPNCAFNEIMQNRIAVETACQTPVVAFTLPFGNFTSDVDPGCAFRIGQTLLRSGLMATAEYSVNRAAEYGLSPDQFSASRNFSINDRAPQQSLFDKNIEEALRDIAAGRFPCGPHFTLGTHAWQGSEGLVKLGEILATHAHQPDIWYCTENEYNARWMQQRHSTIKKTGVKGKTATFLLNRVMPFQLGATQNQTLHFSVPPVSVQTADKACESNSVLVSVPHAAGQSVATVFCNITDQIKEDPYLPGFRMDLSLDTQSGLSGKISNKTGHEIDAYYLTLRPSVCWTNGVQTICLPAKAKAVPFRFELGGQEQESLFAGGPRLVAIQCDFRTQDGLQCRVYRTLSLPPVAAPAREIAYKAIFAGPFPASQADATRMAALSIHGAKATPFSKDACGQWYPVSRPATFARFIMKAQTNAKGWEEQMRESASGKDPMCIVYAIDFKLEHAHAGIHSFLLPKSRKAVFYLDGLVLDPAHPVSLAAGAHRLVIVDSFNSGYAVTTAFRIP